MKIFLRRNHGFSPALALLFFLFSLFAAPGVSAAENSEESEARQQEQPAEPFLEMRSYSSLPGLVSMIGSDAMERFQGFFDASPLVVEPFGVLSEFPSRQRISLLGAMLAEQMAAVVGNEALVVWPAPPAGEQGQHLSGSLLEVDGFLRIQITGLNTRGERRSHVVNVEMSEPMYRALHSFLSGP